MTKPELQQLLDENADRFGVVGAQLAIYDSESTCELVTGYRNFELRMMVTPNTLFQIGSTTKLFNAALVLSLVDQGELNLDTPVREYVPSLRLADIDAQESITLRQLLSMSAGIDNGPYFDFGRGDDALIRYLDSLSGVAQIFQPGSNYGYSNASTNIAGYVASHVMGKTWETLVSQRVWAPLGLVESAQFAEDLLLHPVALGYKTRAQGSDPERMSQWSLPRSLAPAGGLACCSAGDLLRLARMFLSHGRSLRGVQVLSSAAIAVMQRPQVKLPTRLFADEWCVGPYRKKWDSRVLYGHSGTNIGGSSVVLWCPEKDVAVSIVANVAEQGYPFADAVFDVVFPRVFGIDKPLAMTPKNVEAVEVDLRPYVGRFEAFGMVQSTIIDDNKLKLTSRTAVAPQMNVDGCELISLGDGRFLPCDLRVSGNRNWDMAFVGNDADGRPTNLLQGIFPLRRTG